MHQAPPSGQAKRSIEDRGGHQGGRKARRRANAEASWVERLLTTWNINARTYPENPSVPPPSPKSLTKPNQQEKGHRNGPEQPPASTYHQIAHQKLPERHPLPLGFLFCILTPVIMRSTHDKHATIFCSFALRSPKCANRENAYQKFLSAPRLSVRLWAQGTGCLPRAK